MASRSMNLVTIIFFVVFVDDHHVIIVLVVVGLDLVVVNFWSFEC